MYDEVKAFGAAMDAAHEVWVGGLAAIEASMEHSRRIDMRACAACVATNPVYAAYEAAVDVARDALAASTTDPLIRWIAEHVRDYEREARIVLEALPASMAELDQLANDKGWCGDWERLRRTARAAGVLPVETMAEASER